MRFRKTALFILFVFILNINSAFAAVGIEDYFERGWSDEYATEVVEDYESPYSKEIKIVTDLGFMVNDEFGSFNETDNMLYTDFVEMMFSVAGGGFSVTESVSDSQNYVTSEYAVKMFTEILGYSNLTDYMNNDFWSIATQKGLLSGLTLNRNGYITREQVAKLIVNSLEAERVLYDGNAYSLSDTKTLLSDMKLTKIKGFMSAAGESNLYSLASVGNNRVKIESSVLDTGETNAADYLGCYVIAYVYDFNGDNVINAICTDKDSSDYSFVVNADEIVNVTDTEVQYDKNDSGTISKRAVSPSGSVIYNGKYIGTVESVNDEYLKPVSGNVKLIDSKNSGRADIYVVTAYKTGVAEVVSTEKIVLKNDLGAISLIDSYDVFNAYLENELVEASELREWYVLSIAESLDKTICNIYATTNRLSTKVASVSDDEGCIFENGDSAKLDSSFFGSVTPGNSYTFYFTVEGKIATVSAPDEGLKRNYGYLRATINNEFKETASFRIFDLATNQWKSIEANEKVIYHNGADTPDTGSFEIEVEESRETATDLAKKLSGKPQLVVYETDSYGKLTSISTAYDSSGSGIVDDDVFTYNDRYDETMAGRFPFTAGNFVFGYYHMGDNVYQLIVPNDRSDEDKYNATSLKNYDGKIYGPLDIYDADSTRKLNGVVIRYTDEAAVEVYESQKLIVKKVVTTLTAEGEEVYEITSINGKIFYLDKNKSDIFVNSELIKDSGYGPYNVTDPSQIQVGDVLTINTDYRNYLTAVRKDVNLSDLKDNQYFTYVSEFDGPPATMYDYGVVIKNPTGENYLSVISQGDGTDYRNLRPRRVNNVYIYNRAEKKFIGEAGAKSTIVPGDRVFLSSGFYYINALAIIVK